ncbi:MAG: response regulator transcription factor [Neomegalonema sp.]|nr:response regulator transcription factor [Neomegalonema sp.]
MENPDAHILVVDDDARIRVLLKKFLTKQGYRVSEARDAAHARSLLGSLSFDLAVIDVMMPGEDGLSLTRWIGGSMPALLLTARTETEDRIAGLEAGADDYLPKPFEPRELLLRIEAILRRANAVPQLAKAVSIQLGENRFDVERGELWCGEVELRLTTAEIALMRFFVRRMNQPVTRAELVAELGGGDDETTPQERAIDVQITRLRKKIEPNPRNPRYLKTVRGSGYMLAPDGPVS